MCVLNFIENLGSKLENFRKFNNSKVNIKIALRYLNVKHIFICFVQRNFIRQLHQPYTIEDYIK